MTTDDADILRRFRADTARLHQYTMELHEHMRRFRRREPWLPFIGAGLCLACVYTTAKWFLPSVSACAVATWVQHREDIA